MPASRATPRRRPRRPAGARRLVAALLGLVATVLVGCAPDAPPDVPRRLPPPPPPAERPVATPAPTPTPEAP